MKKLQILYEDKEVIVVHKPSKVLTIKDQTHSFSLYQEVSTYVKKSHPKNKVFIVNRLDKETSGIVVFAKTEKIKTFFQDNWQEKAKIREYIAIVEGKITKKKETLTSYLKEDKSLKVYETKKSPHLAITHYETIKTTSKDSLLKIQIQTGRKHQIRVQLAGIGHPIWGDQKYGSQKNPIHRLALHASFMTLKLPHKEISIFDPIPKEMKQIFPKEIETYEREKKEWKEFKK